MRRRPGRRIPILPILTIVTAFAILTACGEPERPSAAQEPDPPRYRESPILQERVERGELPPLEERLPAEPFVVEPFESTGTYDSDRGSGTP